VNKGVELLVHNVGGEEEVLAEERPSRLVSQHKLAGIDEATRQTKKAAKLLKHVVGVREKV
jgi:hypothetical protein